MRDGLQQSGNRVVVTISKFASAASSDPPVPGYTLSELMWPVLDFEVVGPPPGLLTHALSHPATSDILWRKFGHDYLFGRRRFEDALNNAYQIIRFYSVDAVASYGIPHNPVGWAVVLCAEALNLPVIYGRTDTLVPGRAVIVSGVSSPVVRRIPESIRGGLADRGAPSAAALLERRRRDYSAFVPSWEVERWRRSLSRYQRIVSQMQYLVRSPKRIGGLVDRFRAERQLTQDATDPHAHETGFRVLFFLSYQPEKTTFPEAAELAHQYQVASAISNYLRTTSGTLVIKEHPRHMSEPLDSKYRDRHFYSDFRALPNTRFAKPFSSPSDLIGSADLVVTAGGTVILEALANSVPVAYFNRLDFGSLPGLFHFLDVSEIGQVFKTLTEEDQPIEWDRLEDALEDWMRDSFEMSRDRSFCDGLFEAIGFLTAQIQIGELPTP